LASLTIRSVKSRMAAALARDAVTARLHRLAKWAHSAYPRLQILLTGTPERKAHEIDGAFEAERKRLFSETLFRSDFTKLKLTRFRVNFNSPLSLLRPRLPKTQNGMTIVVTDEHDNALCKVVVPSEH
jgi:hypothetical protein